MTENPRKGKQLLRVKGATSGAQIAYQGIMTVDKVYRVTGYARSDGKNVPKIGDWVKGDHWSGTTSKEWQVVDFTFTAGHSNITFDLFSDGYVDFDHISVREVTVSSAGDISGKENNGTVNTSDETSFWANSLSQEFEIEGGMCCIGVGNKRTCMEPEKAEITSGTMSCQSECYDTVDGETEFLCDDFHYCSEGKCKMMEFSIDEFLPATLKGLYTEPQYNISIKAAGVSDYGMAPRMILEVTELGKDEWIKVGSWTVHNEMCDIPSKPADDAAQEIKDKYEAEYARKAPAIEECLKKIDENEYRTAVSFEVDLMRSLILPRKELYQTEFLVLPIPL